MREHTGRAATRTKNRKRDNHLRDIGTERMVRGKKERVASLFVSADMAR